MRRSSAAPTRSGVDDDRLPRSTMTTAGMVLLHHSSAFPQRWQVELLAALRAGVIPPKFLYDTPKQVAAWLALHEAVSPARRDPDVADLYAQSAAAASQVSQVVSIGCGGGQKDAVVLQHLIGRGGRPAYAAVDVGAAMVLTALLHVQTQCPTTALRGVVADALYAPDLRAALRLGDGVPVLWLLFGLAPNFLPEQLLAVLAWNVAPGDQVLLSANLAPGTDYARGARHVLPQYDNAATKRWLGCFCEGLGLDGAAERFRAQLVGDPGGRDLLRIELVYRPAVEVCVEVFGEQVELAAGVPLQALFSYRYTAARLRQLVEPAGFCLTAAYLSAGGEEGVFSLRREHRC